jgi:hypothetical protein
MPLWPAIPPGVLAGFPGQVKNLVLTIFVRVPGKNMLNVMAAFFFLTDLAMGKVK